MCERRWHGHIGHGIKLKRGVGVDILDTGLDAREYVHGHFILDMGSDEGEALA